MSVVPQVKQPQLCLLLQQPDRYNVLFLFQLLLILPSNRLFQVIYFFVLVIFHAASFSASWLALLALLVILAEKLLNKLRHHVGRYFITYAYVMTSSLNVGSTMCSVMRNPFPSSPMSCCTLPLCLFPFIAGKKAREKWLSQWWRWKTNIL